MIIGIRVEAENVKEGTLKHTNTSYFTMVAKGDDDKPAVVPELILENSEEVKRFIECLRMKDIKQSVKEKMDDASSQIEVDRAGEILKNERCTIQYQKQSSVKA
jgi:hypothetical protein